jgi:hypothetical protein
MSDDEAVEVPMDGDEEPMEVATDLSNRYVRRINSVGMN